VDCEVWRRLGHRGFLRIEILLPGGLTGSLSTYAWFHSMRTGSFGAFGLLGCGFRIRVPQAGGGVVSEIALLVVF
jgi:hypothetical protein